MYFALLVSQPPHLDDHRGHYPDPLARLTRAHRARHSVARYLARCLARFGARLARIG